MEKPSRFGSFSFLLNLHMHASSCVFISPRVGSSRRARGWRRCFSVSPSVAGVGETVSFLSSGSWRPEARIAVFLPEVHE